jgi:hypothetical protein
VTNEGSAEAIFDPNALKSAQTERPAPWQSGVDRYDKQTTANPRIPCNKRLGRRCVREAKEYLLDNQFGKGEYNEHVRI